MECIPAEKTLVMKLTQDNKKKVRSPPINDTFCINTDGVYNYIIYSLTNKQYDEVYRILNQLKTIIRCVWKTMFTYSRYPDLAYLRNVSSFPQNQKPFYGNKVLTITPKTKELDSEVLAIIQRNLIPPFDYDINSFSSTLWDKYLLVFDNILLSENIQYRKESKINRDRQLKELSENRDETYEQQYNKIMKDYCDKIESLKQQYIFKIVNYLNWLYYNNVNRELAWAVVLLRMSVITHNKYHNEQFKHTEADFAEYIRNYKFTNTRELLELYVAVNVYRYQFMEHSIISYDRAYIETMIHYLTDTLPTFDEYIKTLMENLSENIPILRLLLPTDQLMKYIMDTCLAKFTLRVKPLRELLLKYYTIDELTQYGVEQRINELITNRDICTLFNKMTSNNYKSITDQLSAYEPEVILKCFKSSCLSDYGPYTKYVLQYMLTLFDKQRLNTELEGCFDGKQKLNKSINPLYGLLMAGLDNVSYYEFSTDKIMTLLEASNSKPSPTIIEFITLKANERLKTAKGYDKFQLEMVLDNIQA